MTIVIGVRQTNKAENLHSDPLGLEASSSWLLKQDSARTSCYKTKTGIIRTPVNYTIPTW